MSETRPQEAAPAAGSDTELPIDENQIMDGDDIALCYGTNDSTHGFDSLVAVGLARRTAAG